MPDHSRAWLLQHRRGGASEINNSDSHRYANVTRSVFGLLRLGPDDPFPCGHPMPAVSALPAADLSLAAVARVDDTEIAAAALGAPDAGVTHANLRVPRH